VAKDLIGAFIGAAASLRPAPNGSGRPRASRQKVLARVREFLDSASTRPGSVGEMARHAGVSERTLRQIVSDAFGVPPKRLLMLRQLHDIRSDLLDASLPATVTGIAADHGVWEFGRFAQYYHRAFGEYPSETLAAGHGVRRSFLE
jgi:AraC family ethanolamine operon transcriptional activator